MDDKLGEVFVCANHRRRTRVRVVRKNECFIQNGYNSEAASEAYFNRYPERRQPNMSIFGRLKENLVEYGGFNKPRPKNYRIQDAEDVAINVVGMVVVNPSISSRQIEAESGNNNSSFQLILNADWISAIGTYNKLSKTNYFLKISFGQMKVTRCKHEVRTNRDPIASAGV
ncbi:hypothetical protein NQ318_018185 [Aromia moschata]|uniref:DUF4817 domain-containing protein n=1 Tax=Aromia moschata TaxID=1265417 RepID=A0AAV8ZF80_9CUCU|nr:hypothetical protein NQ318_018185 [Aromia moschata]